MVDLSRCIAVFIDAGHCIDGNPRRGWWVIDDKADAIIFIDEGYGGYEELSRVLGRELPRAGLLRVKVVQYEELMRLYAPGAEHCQWPGKDTESSHRALEELAELLRAIDEIREPEIRERGLEQALLSLASIVEAHGRGD